jgi:hypothetical protein
MVASWQRENLRDGALRLRSASSTLVCARLRPGARWMAIAGADDGAFDAAALAELDAEIARFGRPLELFLDLSRAVWAASEAAEAWTRWFEARRPQLARVHVLTGSRLIGLTVSVARHFSGAGDLIVLHEDPAPFLAAVAPPTGMRAPGDRFDEPAVPVTRRVAGDAIRVECGGCAFAFASPRAGVLRVRVTGQDAGQFGTAALDEVHAWLAAQDRPAELFFDATDGGATPDVSELWTAWLRAHARRLGHVHLLAPSKVFGLTVAIARALSGTGEVLRVHADAAPFEAAYARATAGRGS